MPGEVEAAGAAGPKAPDQQVRHPSAHVLGWQTTDVDDEPTRFRNSYSDGHRQRIESSDSSTRPRDLGFEREAFLAQRVVELERTVELLKVSSAQRESELRGVHVRLHAQLEASTRLARVGEVASLVSHEVTQPLAVISSFAAASLNLLTKRQGGVLAASVASSLEQAMKKIMAQADRGGEVVRRVQGFVREREAAHEPVSTLAMLQSVLPMVRHTALQRSVRVTVCAGHRPIVVSCDKVMIEQVLLNLSTNAIEAMGDNEEGQPRLLTITVEPNESGACFSVQDTGPGIHEEVARRLFCPFSSTKETGMGLGLSLCRSVIEAHGSKLKFENVGRQAPAEVNHGARFTFHLNSTPPTSGADAVSTCRGVA